MYSYGPPHIAKQKKDDQLEHTYSSYVRIRDVALKTCHRRWMIGRSGKIGSGISVLATTWWWWWLLLVVTKKTYNCVQANDYFLLEIVPWKHVYKLFKSWIVTIMFFSIWLSWEIFSDHCLMGRVFANGPGDLGSIPGRVIPKTLTMVLDTSLFNIQHCKVRIKGKVEQSRKSSVLLYTSV